MKIKTDLVLSSINDTVFALLNNVSFVSAASITDSSVAVQQHTVMIPDDIVAHVIINTDTCLLSISGTWSKQPCVNSAWQLAIWSFAWESVW